MRVSGLPSLMGRDVDIIPTHTPANSYQTPDDLISIYYGVTMRTDCPYVVLPQGVERKSLLSSCYDFFYGLGAYVKYFLGVGEKISSTFFFTFVMSFIMLSCFGCGRETFFNFLS